MVVAAALIPNEESAAGGTLVTVDDEKEGDEIVAIPGAVLAMAAASIGKPLIWIEDGDEFVRGKPM
jgi:hypothetical protein